VTLFLYVLFPEGAGDSRRARGVSPAIGASRVGSEIGPRGSNDRGGRKAALVSLAASYLT